MRKFIPTLTLATTLAFASVSEAGPRARKETPPTSHLNELEHLCQTLGGVAYKYVTARDAGVSYFTILELLRRKIAQRPATGDLEASLDASMLANLRMVYDTPYVRVAPKFAHVKARLSGRQCHGKGFFTHP
jgi:hypothetical protein